jgi:CRP/FNR family transcriptional regulator
MSIDIEFLKAIHYFSGLDSAKLQFIKGFFFEKTVQRDEFILEEGEPSEALYFVVSGVVKVLKTSAEGKEQILRLIPPGESFNDISVFDGGPNPASAQAMGLALLYGIRRDDMERIMREHPGVALNVIRVLSERVRHFVSLVEDLSLARPRLTQQEMAAMAGTAREMIGRSLRVLEENGAIRLDRHRISITDKESLREMAGAAA